VLLRLFLLFTLVPLVELALLIWIAVNTDPILTIGLVVLTGAVGAWLAREQGLRCWREVHRQLSQGQLPAEPLLDGLMILVAGALLITPGVLTDALGFALLVPPIRRRMRRYLAERFKTRITVQPMTGFGQSPGQPDDVIDVEHHPSDD
jgi:UPF0716 protein FxsA